ncbi:MAG: hypothetical protein LBN23_05370 [Paludibacter sp.]|jgi:hypothetical protein|nr:hypothetical protein [Paludibacter sp.]
MKTLFYFSLFVVSALMFSCGPKRADYDALKAQNDSLMHAKHNMQEQIDGYFSAMNRIEQNISKIKEQQGILAVRASSAEQAGDETQLELDIESLNQLLQANKDELARLKNQIKKSEFHSAELERTLVRLTQQLEEETVKVALLQSQVAERDSIISDMSVAIDTLAKNINKQQVKIDEQEETIHTAWYVFGTRKELKKQNIITTDGLFSQSKVLQSDFKKDYFVRIDARNTKQIPFYSSKAKILTPHPKSSYTLEKEDDTYTLVILDSQEFWSISKYLVVEVD